MKLFFFIAVLMLTSCMNPMKSIETQKKEFTEKYKDNFISYEVKRRHMRMAWSGNPDLPPIIFVHGSPGSYDAWAEFLVNKELQKKYHLISVDRPGYGGSDKGKAELSLQKQAEDIIAALQFNKSHKPAIIIGHSFGGPVAARMAMDYPGQVAGLILVAGSIDPSLEETKWYQNLATVKWLNWMVPQFLIVCNDEIMALKSELDLMMPLWEKIAIPTIVLQGDQDDLVNPGNLAFARSKLIHARILGDDMMTGMNHFILWKRPDVILDSISRVEAARQ
ncbi:MAG: alpha/beta fold hydrolase [Pseudobdellovibrio sp.]